MSLIRCGYHALIVFLFSQKTFHSVDDLLEAAEREKLKPPVKTTSHSSAENLTSTKTKAPAPAPLKRPPKKKKGE